MRWLTLRLSKSFIYKKKFKRKSMVALTDNHRKRSSDLSPSTPPSKKLKLSSPPSVPNRTAPVDQFPPPKPLSRPVHGPQRFIRAFRIGLGSGRSTRNKSEPMGNFFSFSRCPKRSGSESGSGSDKGLGLEDYRQLVTEVEDVVQSPPVELPRRRKEEATTPEVEEVDVLRAVEKKRVSQFKELYGSPEKTIMPFKEVYESSEKRIPRYKQLYESSKRRSEPIRSDLEFRLNLTNKKLSGFRLADEVLRKKTEKDFHQPLAPLTDEDEVEVHRAMKSGRRILVTHESSNIEITGELLQCLSSVAWLNDEVINLYLELLKEREKREPKKFLKCHFFNTFFYKRLISGGHGYDYKAVKRWTTQRKIGYGLIDCDKIFVPIHKQVHWCLAIINVKDKKFQYLDSLGGMDRMVLRVLARYIMDEVKDKSGKEIDLTSWMQESVNGLPLQQNGFDCGMFMLKYTDYYSRGLNLTFGQEQMPYFRKRTAKEILRLRAE